MANRSLPSRSIDILRVVVVEEMVLMWRARVAEQRTLPAIDRRRVDALSDSVFAFAATLLVLGLHDPGDRGGLAHSLAQEWPSFAAYVVSFATIAIIWINHNTLFGHLGQLDRPLVFLNLLLLLLVALIPFPTALLAADVRSGGANSHVAAAIYGATMTAMGAVFTAIWARVASREHLLAEGMTPHHARAWVRRSLTGPLVYLAAATLSAVSAPAALIGYAAIPLYFCLPGHSMTPATAAAPAEPAGRSGRT